MGNTESSAAPTEATAATEATEAAAAAPSGWTVQTKQLTGVSESSAGSEAPPTYSVTVPAYVSKMPLAEAICAALPDLFPSTSAAKRACRRKGGPFTVHLAGGAEGRCSTTVAAGDVFEVILRTRRGGPAALVLLHVDERIALVHKPPGMGIHGNGPDTLCAVLEKELPGASPVHRLDAPTEGLVLCGRDKEAVAALCAQFSARRVGKRYHAVLHGDPAEEGGTIDAPIEEQAAATEWRVRWRGHSPTFGPICGVELKPLTGRKHQLRRHCAEVLGCAIVGDVRYTPEDVPTLRQAPLLLAALALSFEHPATGEQVSFELPEPPRFTAFELLPGWPLPTAPLPVVGTAPQAGVEEEETAAAAAARMHRLLAAVVRAGQRQSAEWKARWAAHCTAAAQDGDAVFGVGTNAAVGERSPAKRTEAFLRGFLAAQRADFGDAVWVPAGLWPLLYPGQAEDAVAVTATALEGPQQEAGVQGLSLEELSLERSPLRAAKAVDPLRAAVALGTAGSIVAGATAGAVLAGPAAPLGAVVGGLMGSLVAVETGFMATLSGRQPSREQVNNGALVATSRQGEGGGEGEGGGSAAAVAECKLELVQQRTGLCVEEARYYLDDAQDDADQAVVNYEEEERLLQEELLANPSLRARLN